LIRPEGILPFQFDADAAVQHIRRWLAKQRFRPGDLDEAAIAQPSGVYLPYWTFDIGGEVKWRALVREGSGDNSRWAPRTGSHLVFHNDLLVPASHTLPPDLLGELTDFDTGALAPYSDDALAGWLTEVYQIALADASLVARRRAFGEAKKHIDQLSLGGESVRDLTLNSLGITIDTYKLALLPVWIAGYRHKRQSYPAIVNGQTGRVAGRVPRSGFRKMLAGIFGDD
jgi:hypothetical protein